MNILRRITHAIRTRLALRRLQRAIPRANPASTTVMDLDYLTHARSRSRVLRACIANQLDDQHTKLITGLFEHSWTRSTTRGESAKQREASVTQDCIDRAARIAHQQQRNTAAPRFAQG